MIMMEQQLNYGCGPTEHVTKTVVSKEHSSYSFAKKQRHDEVLMDGDESMTERLLSEDIVAEVQHNPLMREVSDGDGDAAATRCSSSTTRCSSIPTVVKSDDELEDDDDDDYDDENDDDDFDEEEDEGSRGAANPYLSPKPAKNHNMSGLTGPSLGSALAKYKKQSPANSDDDADDDGSISLTESMTTEEESAPPRPVRQSHFYQTSPSKQQRHSSRRQRGGPNGGSSSTASTALVSGSSLLSSQQSCCEGSIVSLDSHMTESTTEAISNVHPRLVSSLLHGGASVQEEDDHEPIIEVVPFIPPIAEESEHTYHDASRHTRRSQRSKRTTEGESSNGDDSSSSSSDDDYDSDEDDDDITPLLQDSISSIPSTVGKGSDASSTNYCDESILSLPSLATFATRSPMSTARSSIRSSIRGSLVSSLGGSSIRSSISSYANTSTSTHRWFIQALVDFDEDYQDEHGDYNTPGGVGGPGYVYRPPSINFAGMEIAADNAVLQEEQKVHIVPARTLSEEALLGSVTSGDRLISSSDHSRNSNSTQEDGTSASTSGSSGNCGNERRSNARPTRRRASALQQQQQAMAGASACAPKFPTRRTSLTDTNPTGSGPIATGMLMAPTSPLKSSKQYYSGMMQQRLLMHQQQQQHAMRSPARAVGENRSISPTTSDILKSPLARTRSPMMIARPACVSSSCSGDGTLAGHSHQSGIAMPVILPPPLSFSVSGGSCNNKDVQGETAGNPDVAVQSSEPGKQASSRPQRRQYDSGDPSEGEHEESQSHLAEDLPPTQATVLVAPPHLKPVWNPISTSDPELHLRRNNSGDGSVIAPPVRRGSGFLTSPMETAPPCRPRRRTSITTPSSDGQEEGGRTPAEHGQRSFKARKQQWEDNSSSNTDSLSSNALEELAESAVAVLGGGQVHNSKQQHSPVRNRPSASASPMSLSPSSVGAPKRPSRRGSGFLTVPPKPPRRRGSCNSTASQQSSGSGFMSVPKRRLSSNKGGGFMTAPPIVNRTTTEQIQGQTRHIGSWQEIIASGVPDGRTPAVETSMKANCNRPTAAPDAVCLSPVTPAMPKLPERQVSHEVADGTGSVTSCGSQALDNNKSPNTSPKAPERKLSAQLRFS